VSPRCAGRRQGGDTHLPSALRAFLLTLAVVDDLLAITVIAVFYTEHINIVALAAALVPLAVFALCVQRGVQAWWLLIPLAVATWVLMHESGVHATVAGVLLGFAVPVRRSATRRGVQIDAGMAEHFEHRLRPISAGVAIPVFAFFAAGSAWAAPAGWRGPSPTRSPWASCSGWWRASRSGFSHHPGAGRGDAGRSGRRPAVDRCGGHFDAGGDRLHGGPADR